MRFSGILQTFHRPFSYQDRSPFFAGRGHSGAAAAADIGDVRSGQFVPVGGLCQHSFG